MEEILNNIVASTSGLIPILYALIVAAGLDTVTGVYAAWTSGTFDSEFLPTFIKSHVVNKIAPIVLTLVAGAAVGGTDSAGGLALVTLGGTSAAAYLASVVGSIKGNLDEAGSHSKVEPTSIEKDTL